MTSSAWSLLQNRLQCVPEKFGKERLVTGMQMAGGLYPLRQVRLERLVDQQVPRTPRLHQPLTLQPSYQPMHHPGYRGVTQYTRLEKAIYFSFEKNHYSFYLVIRIPIRIMD